MCRLAEFEHHEVGDVDDVVDRADPNALNFRAQPRWTWPDFHIVDLARGKKRTFARGADGYAGPFDLDLRVARYRLECLSSQRRNFARETEMAEQIAAVWRDLDVKNCVAWKQIANRRADF